jgi:hypothetical protein
VNRHITARDIPSALDYTSSLGLAGYFVDRVLKAYEQPKKKRSPR